ncbi:hypothetical protein [Thermococcus paralvinellae]|uniref:hypothetical protein n=1 Tax=Thermococcus paralvinellae TaxID=582419 RepID=UPI000B10C4B6|nr:hypothetical protein [Thermococcus paralvinellae]
MKRKSWKILGLVLTVLVIATTAAEALPFLGNSISLVFVDEEGKPLTELSKNVEVQVQIDALLPEGEEVYKTIFYGSLKKPRFFGFLKKGNTIKLSAESKDFSTVLREWNKVHPEGIDTALVISVWILDYEHNQLYRGFTVVNYNTKKLRQWD